MARNIYLVLLLVTIILQLHCNQGIAALKMLFLLQTESERKEP